MSSSAAAERSQREYRHTHGDRGRERERERGKMKEKRLTQSCQRWFFLRKGQKEIIVDISKVSEFTV